MQALFQVLKKNFQICLIFVTAKFYFHLVFLYMVNCPDYSLRIFYLKVNMVVVE